MSSSSDPPRHRATPLHRRLGLLVGTVCLIVLVDRAVFAAFMKLGAIWRSDPVLHYVHRPGVVSNWGSPYRRKTIRINSHGHHDDELPEAKPAGELRGLFLGDSIVMGHGVEASETFVNQLESLLREASPEPARTFQMINAGVQGYATSQYLEMFKRSRRFSPDFLVLGFCMNDVTEPLVVDQRQGGLGLDYHLVVPRASRSLDFLLNETGTGRLASWIRFSLSRDELKARWQNYGVHRMIENGLGDPEMAEAWRAVFRDLELIYALARQDGLPVVLVIFPETYQLRNDSLQEPQRMLKLHGQRNGVSHLDVTKLAERYLASGGVVGDIFLDSNHYTVRGHGMIARELLRHLFETGIAEPRPSDG